MRVEFDGTYTLDDADRENLAQYEDDDGMSPKDALTQVIQDALGPAGATIDTVNVIKP